jgi:alpha-ketoglutarate-dependent taurine dioxygenase
VPALKVRRLTDTVGAEVQGLDRAQLLADDALPEQLLDALDVHGVLVFRAMHLDDEAQIRVSKRLAPVVTLPSNSIPEISVISLDPAKTSAAEYLRGTFDWHLDGTQDEVPHLAAVTTAKVITSDDGGTEFASTYAAYDDLDDIEKERFGKLRVVHSHAAHQRRVYPNPTPEQEAGWAVKPTREHPLVWRHDSGRRSLVIGATADSVPGMEPGVGRALLEELLDRATRPERVYRHDWTVGDLVIWDNRGVLHRACPYEVTSPRELHRVHLAGDEPIR